MALNTLTFGGSWPLTGFWKDGTTGAVLRKKFGALSVPELSISLTYGTGSGQANWAYYASRPLAGTTYDLLDLSGSLTDGLGNTISATKLKLAVIAVASPDGTKKLRVGPQNQSNAAQLHWGGTGATVYKEVAYWDVIAYEKVAGYTVTAATADIFPIYNPTGSSITYSILMAGV